MFFFNRKRKQQNESATNDNKETSENNSTQTPDSEPLAETAIETTPKPILETSSTETVTESIIEESPSQENVDSTPSDSSAADGSKTSWFGRVKQGLSRTSQNLGEGLSSLFLGKKEIDDDLLEDLETQLLTADVGMNATTHLIDELTSKVRRKELNDGDALYAALKDNMADLLTTSEKPLNLDSTTGTKVILVVGVNGVGKTTTIGKLAKRFQSEGKSVMLAAGDTFRAAAVEQLQEWGTRNNVPVVAQHTGADSASVIYDAVEAAKARNIDILIADTAGRLHNKSNLMDELSKVVRVMKKVLPEAPHEVLLVLDAGTGQNAIAQTKVFSEAVDVTGLALTKLDGTAKGGIIFALAQEFDMPVRFIGVGEGIDDLKDFHAEPFIEALFSKG